MAEPTVIEIHNYAGGSRGPLEEIPIGVEVSRCTPEADYPKWGWGPTSAETPMPEVDFKQGKTYTLYETDSDE